MTSLDVDALLTNEDYFIDPYPALHQLQEHAPVVWSNALGAWVVTRYADVVGALRDPARFSSAGRVVYLLDQLPPDMQQETDLLRRHFTVGIGHSDPPAHTRLRALLAPWFQPRLLEPLIQRIQTIVRQLLDQAERMGRMDIVADLAYPLPAIIVLEMLGAPPRDIGLFRRWAMDINSLFAGGGRIDSGVVDTARSSLIQMREYLGILLEEKRRQPKPDLISRLVADQAGDRMDENELVSTCVTLFVAGHETTTYLIGNGIAALLRFPAQLAQLRAQPQLLNAAVEELLRYDAPVQRAWRIAKDDIVLGDQQIQRGQMVLLMLGAANRDPAQFPAPDELDLGRHDNRHVGFGYGIHFCLGAPLARIEAPLAIGAVVKRFPNLIADPSLPLRWRHDVALRGVETLPVLL